jgi:hypothetical protein
MYGVQDMYDDNMSLGPLADGYPVAEAAVSLLRSAPRLLTLFGFWSERNAQASKAVSV